MSEQPQSISVTPFNISPVQLKPTQNLLLIVPDRSSKINFVVGQLVPGKPEVPAVPGVVGCGQILESGTKGQPGYQPFVPAIAGSPTIPAIPAILDSIIPVEQGTIEMTDEEWAGWTLQDDNTYRAAIVASRLSLSILK